MNYSGLYGLSEKKRIWHPLGVGGIPLCGRQTKIVRTKAADALDRSLVPRCTWCDLVIDKRDKRDKPLRRVRPKKRGGWYDLGARRFFTVKLEKATRHHPSRMLLQSGNTTIEAWQGALFWAFECECGTNVRSRILSESMCFRCGLRMARPWMLVRLLQDIPFAQWRSAILRPRESSSSMDPFLD